MRGWFLQVTIVSSRGFDSESYEDVPKALDSMRLNKFKQSIAKRVSKPLRNPEYQQPQQLAKSHLPNNEAPSDHTEQGPLAVRCHALPWPWHSRVLLPVGGSERMHRWEPGGNRSVNQRKQTLGFLAHQEFKGSF